MKDITQQTFKNVRCISNIIPVIFFSGQLILHYIGKMILEEKYEKATLLLLDMIIMSDRFDNELTSEKGVGKVFDKVRLLCNNVFVTCFHEF